MVVPDSLETVFKEMVGLAIGFKDYNYILDCLKFYKHYPDVLISDRIKNYYYARKHLLWDKYEDNIFDAYNKAL